MKNFNSAPGRPALESKRHQNVSMRQHYERKGISCSPMQDDDLSANYKHEDLSKHYYTPPRGGMANQQHEQLPNSQNHQQMKSKRRLLSRASKQFIKKLHNKDERPHHIHTEENYYEEEAYFREAKDPSPTNEQTYAVLLDKGDRNFDSNVVKRDRLPEDNWTVPRIVEVGMDFTPTSTFPNQKNNVAITTVPQSLPQTSQLRSSAATTPPIQEKYYQGESRQESNANVHMRNVDDQRQPQHKLIDSSKDKEIKQLRQKLQEKEDMKHKVDGLKYQLAQREHEMEMETTKLREELRKQQQNMEEMHANTNAKAQEYEIKVERDLETYKRKCSTYREQLLQKEREIAQVEQTLYNERKKILSLESENETLINVAEERVGNVMTSEKAKSSELKRYKDQFEKYRNERAKMEQALHNERKKVSMLETENEMLIKAAEEKVGNVMTLEKAKSSELKSYKDQCEKYRERVFGLERKVMSMESALSSTGSITRTLEEEKKEMSSELSQAEANVATLKSEMSDKDIKIGSLQLEIANLQSTKSNLETALRSVQRKTPKLENENASILDQLKEKSMLVEKLQISSAKYKEIEDENASLKRKNDELTAKEMQMKEELRKSEVFSSNTERLRKMLSDSESYISSLQSDLSSARTTHHQQLTDARAKYSSEIHSITAQLETQIDAKRELEIKNNNLEDEVLSLKRKLSEIEDLRCSLSESTQKVSSLKRELASNERTVAQLRSKIQELEGEKSVIASLRADLSQAQDSHGQQLIDVRSQYSSEIEDINAQLETQITAKQDLEIKNSKLEDKVLSLESKLAEIEDQSAHQSKSKSEQLFKLMEHADILRKKLSKTSEEMSVLKRKLDNNERTATELRSKIQSLEEEKLGMSENISALKSELSDYTTEKTAEIKELQNCIKERDDALVKKERIISSEAAKNLQQIKDLNAALGDLKKELEGADEENNLLREQLSNSKKLLRKQIDDLTLERTQADSKIITLNTDIKALKESMGARDQLTGQMRLLSERKEKEINELKRAFDADRKAQDASIDSLIASKEDELRSIRTTNEELKGQIKKLRGETVQLKRQSESCKAELKGCEEKLSVAKEELSTAKEELAKKLSEAKRSYQENADSLTEHYMKIEDEIRTLLNKARQDKDTAEKKLAADKKETDRLMDEFYSQKKELTSRVMKLKDKLEVTSNERDALQQEEKVLKATIASKEKEAKELQKTVDTMKDQFQSASKMKLAADKKETERLMDEFHGLKKELTSRVMELTEQLEVTSKERDALKREEEHLKSTIASKEKEAKKLQESAETMKHQFQKDIDSLNNELFEQKSSYECEKRDLTSHVMELTEQLEVILNERDALQREEEHLKSTIASKEKEAKELQESVITMKDQFQSALKEEVTEKAGQQKIQNTNLLHHKSGTSKSELRAIVVDVEDSGHVETEVENEVNSTPSNHKKKQNNKKTKFYFDESPKVAKAKANAGFALLTPRAPLTPRISRNTHFNFDGWITPRTPRLEINGTAF